MKVESGKFYFIKDEFFDVFKDYKLMETAQVPNASSQSLRLIV